MAFVHRRFRVLGKAGAIFLMSASLLSPAWAQQSANGVQQSSGSPGLVSDTAEQVQANIDDLNKQPIADKDVLLLRDLDHIDGEVARVTQQLNWAKGWEGYLPKYTALADRLKNQTELIAQFDCQNNLHKFRDTIQSYNRAYYDFTSNFTPGTDVDFTTIALPPFSSTDLDNCTNSKEKFSSPAFSGDQKRVLDNAQKMVTDYLGTQTELAAAETKYLDALKKRRLAVQDKLNASQPALQIGSNLWLLLLILATACVCTILGIKLFASDLQMEWVASGQVIQFVTVMILLSVILALGLSMRLSENTLGTLLGGIAGYVLAQGVGRSAARNVERAAWGPAGVPPAGSGGTGATGPASGGG